MLWMNDFFQRGFLGRAPGQREPRKPTQLANGPRSQYLLRIKIMQLRGGRCPLAHWEIFCHALFVPARGQRFECRLTL